MPQDQSRGRKVGQTALMRVALGAALAALVVCANTAAARAGDADDSDSVYDRLMRVLGMKNPLTMEYGIDYSERSPLVVPPTRDLPPPVAAAPPATPDWPKDADIRRRARAKAEQKVGPHVDWASDSDRVLRPDELNPAGAPRPDNTSAAAGNATSQQDDRYPRSGAKKSIFSFDWFKKEEYATFTGEPARTTLTDPPPGYLTPSPDQPYGVGPEKKAYKIPTVADRVEAPR